MLAEDLEPLLAAEGVVIRNYSTLEAMLTGPRPISISSSTSSRS